MFVSGLTFAGFGHAADAVQNDLAVLKQKMKHEMQEEVQEKAQEGEIDKTLEELKTEINKESDENVVTDENGNKKDESKPGMETH